tara:strand:- start:6539 stop:7243 length:705 start_codon:yes stop_codon:yes gene_type:complete
MNEGIKERISALVDGELSEFEVRRVLEEIETSQELRDYWERLQITKMGLNDDSLGYIKTDIADRVAKELGEYKAEPNELTTPNKTFLSLTVAASACLVIAIAFVGVDPLNKTISPEDLFASETNKKIADAIATPQAMQVLDIATKGMNVTLQGVNSGNRGQVYANYRLPSNGKTFKVSLMPASTALPELNNNQAPKLSYLKTKNGFYIISVTGDISSKQKSQILRNANFSINNR